MSDTTWTNKDLGPVTAYAEAVAGGYEGTKAQFETDMGNSATNATTASTKALIAEGYANGKQNGAAVASGSPYYQNNAEYFKTAAETAAASASAAYGTALLAPNYSSEATYAVGDHVIYSGNYYVCNTAITTAESWTAAHWTQVTVGGESADLKSAIGHITADEIIDFQTGKAVPLNTNPVNTTPATNASFECAVIECLEGDAFTVSVSGGSGPRAWGFLDTNKAPILCANASVNETFRTIIAPKGSKYLVLNNEIQVKKACAFHGKIIGDNISDIEDDIFLMQGIRRINMLQRCNVLLGNDSTDFSLNPDNNFECAIVPCSEGQVFTVSCEGATNPRAYAFVKSNGTIIYKTGTGITVTNMVVIAPPLSAYLIINNKTSNVVTSYVGDINDTGIKKTTKQALSLTVGSIYYGSDTDSTVLSRTPMMYLPKGTELVITNGFRARVVFYENGTFVKQTDFMTTNYTIPQGGTFRIIAGYSSEITLDSEKLANVAALVYLKLKTIDKNILEFDPHKPTYSKTVAILPKALGGATKRIPFCDVTNNGVLIVGCDNRFNNGADLNPIDICITRSFDNGKTFENPQTVLEKTSGGTNYRVMDGAILVDRSNNRVFVFGHRINEETAWETQTSGDYDGYPVYKYSDDDGATWSEEVSLKSLKTSDMITLFDGVGKGITMSNGTLVMPMQAKMKTDNTEETGDMFNIQSCIAYSENHGSTWTLSNLLPCYSSECQVVELDNGDLMINARSYVSRRRVFTTDDMGETWVAHSSDKTIIEPYACEGCLSKIKMFGSSLYTFSNPHSLSARVNLMVQYSKDATEWNEGIVIVKEETAGYSCTAFYNGMFFVATEQGGIYIYAFPVEYIKTF